MKRLLAVLLLCCCLLSAVPVAMAEPADEAEPAAQQTGNAEQTPEEAPAQEKPEETTEPEETDAPEEPAAQTDLSVLARETAIRTMDIVVTVDKGGRASVTQTVELGVVGDLKEIRFSFPEGAKKTDIAGRWTKSEKEQGIRYLSVSNRKGFTGTQTFQLSYTMDDLVTGADASQVLTLPLLSLQDYQIGVLKFSISLPQEFEGDPRFSSGYYNIYVEDIMTYTCGGGVITGMVNQIMRDNDTLTMTLSLPEGYFAGRYGESKLSLVLTVFVFLLLALALVYWFRTLKNPPLRVNARTLPPDGVNPGDVPFLLAGGHADFNLLVSHWAVLGYLSFYINKSGHVILRRRMSMGNERRAFERKLFELLFGGETLCDGASLRYKRVGEKAMAVIPRYWAKRIYEKRSGSPVMVRLLCAAACAFATMLAMDVVAPEKLHGLLLFVSLIAGFTMGWVIPKACGAFYLDDWVFTAIGIGCAILLLIVGGMGETTLTMLPAVAVTVFLGWQTIHGGQRRPYGDEVIAQTLGFRRFIHNAADHHVMQMLRRDPQYFYKILPYAEAMGKGRHFVSLFHDCKLEPCQWYESARSIPTTASAFYDHYVDTLDLLNISLRK